MERPKSNKLETEQAIKKVKQFTKSEKVISSIQGLLSIIPYAGGPLYHVLSEYRGKRNAERIFNTLNELKEAIEELSGEKRNILSEDEVVEIVENTLEEISRTSSEEKLRYLRNSLTKAFTKEDIAYSQKQFYLLTLRSLSLGELELLKEIYMSSNHFVEIKPLSDKLNIPESLQENVFIPKGYETEYAEPPGGETLWDVLLKRLKHISEGVLEGLVDSLDAKGLSRIRPNLDKKTVKIVTEIYQPPNHVMLRTNHIDIVEHEHPKRTPIEASQTQFGRDFIKYIQS